MLSVFAHARDAELIAQRTCLRRNLFSGSTMGRRPLRAEKHSDVKA